MRVVIVEGRAALEVSGGSVDCARASDGRFGPDPHTLYEQWDAFREWADDYVPAPDLVAPFAEADLGLLAPRPSQVFAAGLNYGSHADEAGIELPSTPPVFTKFPSCLSGPVTEVALPSDGDVDWEVELVAVIGRTTTQVAANEAWDHVAGLTVGQDLSERHRQLAGSKPQFSLGKSLPGFGPIGPRLVTPDELADPDDLEIECSVNGETVQKDRTSSLLFSVPALLAHLSEVCTLRPGDLVWTGTPSGVGHVRDPRWYLEPGDELVSRIGGIGALRQRFV